MDSNEKIALLTTVIILVTLAMFIAASICLFALKDITVIAVVLLVGLLFGLIVTDVILYCLLQEEIEERKRHEKRRKTINI